MQNIDKIFNLLLVKPFENILKKAKNCSPVLGFIALILVASLEVLIITIIISIGIICLLFLLAIFGPYLIVLIYFTIFIYEYDRFDKLCNKG